MALRPSSSRLRDRGRAEAGLWLDNWTSHLPGDKLASTRLRIGGPTVVQGANVPFDLIVDAPGR